MIRLLDLFNIVKKTKIYNEINELYHFYDLLFFCESFYDKMDKERIKSMQGYLVLYYIKI